MSEFHPETNALEWTSAWRSRLAGQDPSDRVSAAAADLLERLSQEVQSKKCAALWAEVEAMVKRVGRAGAEREYVKQAEDYRGEIGVSVKPADGAAYLHGLLAIARSLA